MVGYILVFTFTYPFICFLFFAKDVYILQVAFPLVSCALLALLVLVVCRLRTSSPKAITDEIKRELKSKGMYFELFDTIALVNLYDITVFVCTTVIYISFFFIVNKPFPFSFSQLTMSKILLVSEPDLGSGNVTKSISMGGRCFVR